MRIRSGCASVFMRTSSAQEPPGVKWIQQSNTNSNLLSITDAEGGVTSYTYDPRNLQTFTVYPNDGAQPGGTDNVGGDRVAMTYDALHRPAIKTDQIGVTCTFVYDLAGRLTEKQYRDAGPAGPPAGLVAHWKLNDNAGTTASDSSGGGHHAELQFGPAWTTPGAPLGSPAASLSFDGINDRLYVAPAAALSPGTSLWTVSAWVKTTAADGRIVFRRNNPGGTRTYSLAVSGGKAEFELNVTGNAFGRARATSTTAVNDGQWHLITGVRTGPQTAAIYVDGTLEATDSFGSTNTDIDTNFYLFIASAGNSGHLDAAIDDVRIYNRALAANEVAAIAGGTPPSDDGPPTDTDLYTYDLASRPLTAESERYADTVTFTWTDDGLLESETLEGTTSFPGGMTVTRGYDAADRLTTITYPLQGSNGVGTSGGGQVVTRTFTPRNQLASVTMDPDGVNSGPGPVNVADYAYDPGMLEINRGLGNGLERNTAYTRADDLVTAMTVQEAAGVNPSARPGLSWSYTYDANKNLASATTGGVMQLYGFTTEQDKSDRLTKWLRPNGELTQWALSLVGDWDSYSGSTLDPGSNQLDPFAQTRTHNPVHEIETITSGAGGGGAASAALSHDPKGNLTTDEDGQTYTYDFDNQLTGVKDSNGNTLGTYTYDALGRRVTKQRYQPGTSNPTDLIAYMWLTDPGSGLWQLLAEYEQNTLARTYTYGEYVDEPITLTVHGPSGGNAGTYWYHRDRQYNITGLTDATGTVVERYAYTPYGERRMLAADGVTVRQASAYGNTHGHQGLWHSDKSGLTYNRWRHRHVFLGRWTSRDPLRYTDSANLYEVAVSMPLTFIDPDGRDAVALNIGEAEGHPWSDANLGGVDVYGETKPVRFQATFSCGECEDDGCWKLTSGNIVFEQTIKIDVTLHNENGESVELTCGHEQRHIRLNNNIARLVEQDAEASVADDKCTSQEECERRALALELQATRQMRQAQEFWSPPPYDHFWPLFPTGPGGGLPPYDGDMPRPTMR